MWEIDFSFLSIEEFVIISCMEIGWFMELFLLTPGRSEVAFCANFPPEIEL